MSEHSDKLDELKRAAEEAEEMETPELTLLERVALVPLTIVGWIFFKLIAWEKKKPRKNFGGHAEAVKAAAKRNKEQRERERAEQPRCKYCNEPVEREGQVHAGGCGKIG